MPHCCYATEHGAQSKCCSLKICCNILAEMFHKQRATFSAIPCSFSNFLTEKFVGDIVAGIPKAFDFISNQFLDN